MFVPTYVYTSLEQWKGTSTYIYLEIIEQYKRDLCNRSFLSFFTISFWRTHMSYFGATGTPVLDFWWRLLWGVKPEWVLPYSHYGGECNVHSPRSTSGATLAHLLAAGAPPVLSPHTVVEVRLPGFDLMLSEYLSDALPIELNRDRLCKRS